MTLTLVVSEAPDIETVHRSIGRPGVKFLPSVHSSEPAWIVVMKPAHRGHVTSVGDNQTWTGTKTQ